MCFTQEVYLNACLPKAITPSILAFILKKDHPQTLLEYRPISLIGSLYEIIAKSLALRFWARLFHLVNLFSFQIGVDS